MIEFVPPEKGGLFMFFTSLFCKGAMTWKWVEQQALSDPVWIFLWMPTTSVKERSLDIFRLNITREFDFCSLGSRLHAISICAHSQGSMHFNFRFSPFCCWRGHSHGLFLGHFPATTLHLWQVGCSHCTQGTFGAGIARRLASAPLRRRKGRNSFGAFASKNIKTSRHKEKLNLGTVFFGHSDTTIPGTRRSQWSPPSIYFSLHTCNIWHQMAWVWRVGKGSLQEFFSPLPFPFFFFFFCFFFFFLPILRPFLLVCLPFGSSIACSDMILPHPSNSYRVYHSPECGREFSWVSDGVEISSQCIWNSHCSHFPQNFLD